MKQTKAKNKTTKPEIALKSVKVILSMSEETFCYEATLYVDGKRVGRCYNHGHGGPDDVTMDSGSQEDLDALNQRIKETFPRSWPAANDPPIIHANFPDGMPRDLEWVCNELVSDHLMAKDLKRLLRSNYLGKKKRGGGIFQWKKSDFARAGRGGDQAWGGWLAEDYICLNDLPFAEALAIFKQKGEKA